VIRRTLSWRSAVVGGYVAWALVCTFVFGGGATVLVFFAVWGGVWLAFSLFWRWADGTRRLLLRKRGYY
jgi:hypothetical protein